MLVYGCCLGTAEVSHSRSKFAGTSSLSVHSTESDHRSQQRSQHGDGPSVKCCLSTAVGIGSRSASQLSHLQGDGALDESWQRMDHQPVILLTYSFTTQFSFWACAIFCKVVGAVGGYMFSGCPSVRPSVIHVVVLFPRYLQYLLTDFRQTFVTGASRDRDELVRFWGQKVKVQGHGMTECIPDFPVSTISPVSIDRFSPNFCHWCILGHR